MAVPIIQLGQCGNQIGSNFYDLMFNEGQRASQAHQLLLHQFFYQIDQPNSRTKNNKNRAKAFQIDMQPKVVNKNLQLSKNKNWNYDSKLSFVKQQGSGNNWAYGCNVHGPHVEKDIRKMLRKFAEQQDYINCFCQIQSLAGGTGSGLGTFIIRLLNDMFPKTPKFITCVMPHLSGQVILQAYNASLSLGTTYNQADGIFIIQNDQVSQICDKLLKLKNTSLNEINEVISRNLASLYFPVINKSQDKIFSIQQNGINYGVDFCEQIFSDPGYKIASIQTTPHGPKQSQTFNSDNWLSIQNDLLYRKKWQSKGGLIIARGKDHQTNNFSGKNVNNYSNNSRTNISNSQVFTLFDKHSFYSYNRSACLVDNGPKFVQPFEMIIERAYGMLKQSAYIYQYNKYNLERDDFLQVLNTLEGVQTNYKKLYK